MDTPTEHDLDPETAVPIKTAARYLNVSASTLQRMELSGQIRSFKTPGGHRRFTLAELDRVRQEMAG